MCGRMAPTLGRMPQYVPPQYVASAWEWLGAAQHSRQVREPFEMKDTGRREHLCANVAPNRDVRPAPQIPGRYEALLWTSWMMDGVPVIQRGTPGSTTGGWFRCVYPDTPYGLYLCKASEQGSSRMMRWGGELESVIGGLNRIGR